MRKTEVTGVAKLLCDETFESPEECAQAIIKWLDEDRAKRTSYVAVMQFGETRPAFYVGLGPYPGRASAIKAAQTHPAAGEAYRIAVVPMTSAEGVAKMKTEIDEYRKGMNA